MANVLEDKKKQQVLALGRLGWPLRRIEEATGVRRETASKYLRAEGLVRGRGRPRSSNPAISVSTDTALRNFPNQDIAASKPAISVSTDSEPSEPAIAASIATAPSASACEPHREFIELAALLGRPAKAIWQDLVDDHGFKAQYASVRRFVVKLRPQANRDAHPVIVTSPGEEAQVDYGTGPMVRDPETGKYRRTRLFSLTLGCSRKSVRLLTFRSSTKIWAELHERSFRQLGGAPRVLVLDNLREGVLEADIYDPTINPLFRDVLRHYGCVALPCRVRDPNRKGKVESAIGHAQKILKGLRFETIAEAQTYLDRWESRWADTRIHGTTKRQVAQMFAEEQPHLLPLPLEPFRYYRFGERVVHLDGCVEVEAAYYGVPPGRLGTRVSVQWNDLVVRILDLKTGALLREHIRQRRGHHRIAPEDLPKKTRSSTHRLLARAAYAGPNIGALAKAIHQLEGERGIRRILGVISLMKKFGSTATDEACATALEVGAPSYRFVRRYLERHPSSLTLKQVDPLIRELTHYRELIERRTKGDELESD